MLKLIGLLILGCTIFIVLTSIFGLLWALMINIAILVGTFIVGYILVQDGHEDRDMRTMSQEEYEDLSSSTET